MQFWKVYQCLAVVLFLGFSDVMHAQIHQGDTLSTTKLDTTGTNSDSTKVKEEKESIIKVLFKGKPGKALMWSIIPGGGQLYNRRYWKVPIIYAGLGGAAYIIIRRREIYNIYDEAFRMRVDLGDQSQDRFKGIYDVNTLQTFRREADKALFESYVWFGLIYLASGIEAFVDRHLMEFDISDDLTMGLIPGQPVWTNPLLSTSSPYHLGVVYRF